MKDVVGIQRSFGRNSSLGILLINTGTPDAPTPSAVRRFLAQFLADPRVIEYPRWLWLPLLHGIILQVRPRRSARLYQRIWTSQGSPLLTTTKSLGEKLESTLQEKYSSSVTVAVGMCYGNPSIASGLRQLKQAGAQRLLVLPLFPQYSATTTAAAFDALFNALNIWRWVPSLQLISDYHDHPAYISALVHQIHTHLNGESKLLFSFHGIPRSYVQAGDPYEDQCRCTAALVTEQLDLQPDAWEVAFQSRFGPQEWLSPYTDRLLQAWGQDGLSHISVVCPGFAVDCLETLDEIAHEGRLHFLESGSGAFDYIPALNDSGIHVQALAKIIMEQE